MDELGKRLRQQPYIVRFLFCMVLVCVLGPFAIPVLIWMAYKDYITLF